jgi:hypothetical protein
MSNNQFSGRDPVIPIDEYKDSELKIHLGKRGELMSERIIYQQPTGEPTWRRTLRWLKHVFDPRLKGADPPESGWEMKDKVNLKTSEDVTNIYNFYKKRLVEMEQKIRDLEQDKLTSRGISGRDGVAGKLAKEAEKDCVEEIREAKNKQKNLCDKATEEIKLKLKSLQKEKEDIKTQITLNIDAEKQKKLKKILQDILKLLGVEAGGTEDIQSLIMKILKLML